jgi:hypothetical protein
MKLPVLSALSLVLPLTALIGGYFLAKGAKGATNMGEALGPYFAWGVIVVLAAIAGELAAIVSIVRGEPLKWLSWLGILGNTAILLSAFLFVVKSH